MRVKATGIPSRVLIVGEAPGKEEEMLGVPFMGASGSELRRMLKTAGFDRSACAMTNVFMDRPKDNDLATICAPRAGVPKDYKLLPLSTGKYVRPEFLFELDRLREEILACKPDLIIALGNTATWALLGRTGISKLRGAVFPCELAPGFSVLPSYHPAAVLRDWAIRPIAITDLIKAKRFLDEGFTVPRRELWLEPTLEEVRTFVREHILARPPPVLSLDIETAGGTITCIGFSPRPDLAITIPFHDPKTEDKCYWSLEDERTVLRLVAQVLRSPIPKLGQNGLYDIQYIYHCWRIQVNRYLHDTMIRHHSLYPEMEKGLGFMGTIYTDEAPWKLLRDRNRDNFKIGDDE